MCSLWYHCKILACESWRIQSAKILTCWQWIPFGARKSMQGSSGLLSHWQVPTESSRCKDTWSDSDIEQHVNTVCHIPCYSPFYGLSLPMVDVGMDRPSQTLVHENRRRATCVQFELNWQTPQISKRRTLVGLCHYRDARLTLSISELSRNRTQVLNVDVFPMHSRQTES